MELTKAEVDRFFNKVDKRKDEECWEWTGAKFNTGYGMVALKKGRRKTHAAHRISWIIQNKEPIPTGLIICHTCDNRLCVNPNHLYAGTHLQNNLDTIRRGRTNRKLGEECSWAKISEKDARYILESTEKQADLAQKFGVDPSTICQIKSGKRWKHLHR